jgi:hypothetical protein
VQAVLNVYTLAEFIDPDWADKVNQLRHRVVVLARQTTWDGGPVRQPYAGVDFIRQSGFMNSATGLAPLQDDDRLEDRHPEFKTSCPAHHANLSFPVYLIIIRNKHTTTHTPARHSTPHHNQEQTHRNTHTSQTLHTSS